MLLGKVAIDALNDYEKQRKEGGFFMGFTKLFVPLAMPFS